MASVLVVRRAGALSRDHRGAERMLRRARASERRAVGRLAETTQDRAADADLGLAGGDVLHLEQLLGVVCAVLVAHAVARLGNRADAAPLPVPDLEALGAAAPRRPLAVARHRTGILVLHFRPPLLELAHRHQDAIEQVHRLEARDDNRHAVALAERFVLPVPHDGADMARTEERLAPGARRLADRGGAGGERAR